MFQFDRSGQIDELRNDILKLRGEILQSQKQTQLMFSAIANGLLKIFIHKKSNIFCHPKIWGPNIVKVKLILNGKKCA